jgi:hypothetical protein
MKKLLKVSAVFAIIAGIIMIVGGLWGIYFTHTNIAREKIVTPEDARIPNASVRGPMTLMAQSDIIREHTLHTTGGKTFAEMPRQIPKVDATGKPVLDDKGEAVMVTNGTRDMWITATALTTALHLAVFSYVFSCLIILFGLISLWTGVVFNILSKKSQ